MMKTIVHSYRFDTTKADERQAYAELCEKLKQGPHWMKSHGGKSHYMPELDGAEVELDADNLFENQWNTAPLLSHPNGLRLFDWAEDAIFNRGYENTTWKQGHYLEQTDEMREIRYRIGKCGYCGGYGEPGQFHMECLDSEYLKEEDLRLLRMVRICDSGPRRTIEPLTESERELLVPKYQEAQLHGTTERGKKRIAKLRQDIEEKFQKGIRRVTAEHDGWLWLLDHGIKTDNVIYYSHTDTFSFGWRTPLSDGLKSAMLDVLVEFPFAYELKCTSGDVSTKAKR